MAELVTQRIRSRWSEIFLCAAVGLGPLCLACSSYAQTGPSRFAIEASQVLAAMRDGALPGEGVEVKLAAQLTSSVAKAQVEVESASPAGPHELRIRLACSNRSECVPFFAMATYPNGVDVSKLHVDRTPRPAGVQAGETAHPALEADSTVRAADGLTPTNTAKDRVMLHAGAPAMLEIEADRIHVRIEVICLQSGAPGSRIRVSSLDHKQTYVAEVLTPTLLKGELVK